MADLHSYEYVNRSHQEVAHALRRDPAAFFQRATASATERAGAIVANLKVEIAGLQVGKDVAVRVSGGETDSFPTGDGSPPTTRFRVEWEATDNASFFPTMRGELAVYPLSSTETQLDFRGRYEPPLGLLGSAANALVGHRLAEASVHRFLEDLVTRLQAEIPQR